MAKDAKRAFTLLVMGCTGGPFDTNLSGYLVAPHGSSAFIALDAGTLLSGIEILYQRGHLKEIALSEDQLSFVGTFFLNHVKAYLISHAHLDHISGLVLNSQVDISKPLFGIDTTIDNLRDFIFNGKIWPNYGSEGESALHQYHYHRLKDSSSVPIPNTEMTVEAFPLSHPGDYLSTAFLIGSNGNYLLYMGDTSSDLFEKEKRLEKVWKRIIPLIRQKTLKGILLECSYPHKHADQTQYGHLESDSLLQELKHLESISETSLHGIPFIVTHRKGSLLKNEDQKKLIAQELEKKNFLRIHWIFPNQGDRFSL